MTAEPSWEILDGLPAYGPMAQPFPPTGQGKHSEGLVVRFRSAAGTWIGNFQRDWLSCDRVFQHPDGRHVVVVAGGTAYVVDPDTRELTEHLDIGIEEVLPIPESNLVLLGNGLWFEALGADGMCWRSRRLSWDGMRNVTYAEGTVRGEAFAPQGAEGAWYPFELDVTTGAVTWGSYTGPPM